MQCASMAGWNGGPLPAHHELSSDLPGHSLNNRRPVSFKKAGYASIRVLLLIIIIIHITVIEYYYF